MVLTRKEVGQRIKEARNKKSMEIGKKYTQHMLAEDLGISRSYLADIEYGRIYPNFILLSKIADICGVSVELLTNSVADSIPVDLAQPQAHLFDGEHEEKLTQDELKALKTYLLLYRENKK